MTASATTTTAEHEGADEAGMVGARIERLLGELRASAGPMVWPRVEELMVAVTELYARGLGRLFDHLAAAGALDERVRAALAGDALVASLLALHGLHPLPLEARVRRVLDEVAPQLGRIELVALEGGVARLDARDAPPLAGAAELLERALVEAAPELERVEIEGLRAPAAVGPLVHIDLARSRAAR